MKKSRILICGGRDFTDLDLFNHTMNEARKWFDDEFVIIEGGALGADSMAKFWANSHGAPHIRMEANWKVYSKRAGHLRNGWMLKWAMPDLVVAFPGGDGTDDMIKQSKKAGVDVWPIKK